MNTRTIIMNIGLAIAHSPRQLTVAEVQLGLKIEGFGVDSIEVHTSDTERTAVVVATFDNRKPLYPAVRNAAFNLMQEVIAVYKPERQQGAMLGSTIDLDDAWGAFDPTLFIMPGGQHLAQPATYQGHLADGSGIQKHSAGGAYPYVLVLRDSTRPGAKFDWGMVGGCIADPVWHDTGAAWDAAVDRLKGRIASA